MRFVWLLCVSVFIGQGQPPAHTMRGAPLPVRFVKIEPQAMSAKPSLLTNGSFEIGDEAPEGWTFSARGSGVRIEWETASPVHGQRALKFANDRSTGVRAIAHLTLDSPLTVKPKTTYSIVFWLKTDGFYQGSLTDGIGGRFRSPFEHTQGQWVRKSIEYTTDDQQTSLPLQFQIDSATDGLCVDGLQVFEGAPSAGQGGRLSVEWAMPSVVFAPDGSWSAEAIIAATEAVKGAVIRAGSEEGELAIRPNIPAGVSKLTFGGTADQFKDLEKKQRLELSIIIGGEALALERTVRFYTGSQVKEFIKMRAPAGDTSDGAFALFARQAKEEDALLLLPFALQMKGHAAATGERGVVWISDPELTKGERDALGLLPKPTVTITEPKQSLSLEKWLEARHKSLATLNLRWGTKHESFEQAAKEPHLTDSTLYRMEADDSGRIRLTEPRYIKSGLAAIEGMVSMPNDRGATWAVGWSKLAKQLAMAKACGARHILIDPLDLPAKIGDQAEGLLMFLAVLGANGAGIRFSSGAVNPLGTLAVSRAVSELGRLRSDVRTLGSAPPDAYLLYSPVDAAHDPERHEADFERWYLALITAGFRVGILTERALEEGVTPPAETVIAIPGARRLSDEALVRLNTALANGAKALVPEGAVLDQDLYGRARTQRFVGETLYRLPNLNAMETTAELLKLIRQTDARPPGLQAFRTNGEFAWGVVCQTAQNVSFVINLTQETIEVDLKSALVDHGRHTLKPMEYRLIRW
ncbi:MAG: hypothetical protein HUU60_01140 [Armatimonadetes bacterium]|nr:hypothetical protein [Armatimonadota bacterium]